MVAAGMVVPMYAAGDFVRGTAASKLCVSGGGGEGGLDQSSASNSKYYEKYTRAKRDEAGEIPLGLFSEPCGLATIRMGNIVIHFFVFRIGHR